MFELGLYTHHVDKVPPIFAYCEPPVLERQQAQNCQPTPSDDIFTDNDLLYIVHKAEEIQRKPLTAADLPPFVKLHKIILVACVLCLLHTEGACATIANSWSLEEDQISLDDLKKKQLYPDFLQHSRCCCTVRVSIVKFC